MKVSATTERFAEALAFTARAFSHKVRKGSGVPYVVHLLYVTSLVGEAGGDEDQLIASLLHDYLEDIQGAQVSELQERFGERVARLVLSLSDTTVHPKPPWLERKLDICVIWWRKRPRSNSKRGGQAPQLLEHRA